MRLSSLVALALAFAACRVSVPHPRGLKVNLHANAAVRAQVHVTPPPAPAPPVALEDTETVEFFGVPLDGVQDVVFVLDRSGSMDEPATGRIAEIGATPEGPPPAPPRKIDVAQSELVDALERLPAGTRMNVLFFSSDLEAFSPTMVALEDSGREALVSFVRETVPSGSTALAPAMRSAFLMNAHRVVLLSDGLGNVGGGAGDVLRDAREAMRGGVRIDTIGLGRAQDAALLEALARESGGLYQAF